MEWMQIAYAIAALLVTFYYWSTWNFGFWKSQNVAGPEPLALVGNLKDVFLGKISFGELVQEFYKKYRDEPLIGIFLRRSPSLIINDPDLIKDVLIKDFSIFSDRGIPTFEKAEPLSQHLVNLEPARWRPLRTKLTPTFTSGKLRKMFYLVLECGTHFQDYIDKLVAKGEPVECRELTAKFTTDVIGMCAFGLKLDALADEDSEFRKMGRKIFEPNLRNFIGMKLIESAPWLYSLLSPILVDSKETDFFLGIMKNTMEHRKKNQIVRHDFIDLLMELKEHPEQLGDIKLTDTLLASQLYVFFLAGFETSSTTMSNALYELAQNQPIQDKLRNEISEHLQKNNGELTYELITSMTYLDMVFKETLRKYPPVPVLPRRAQQNYKFEGTKVTIPEGTTVFIPVLAIHRDPAIYPEPEVFDPERFTSEAVNARHVMNWLAFGDGPRNCIGARFANYQSKVGLIKIIEKFKVEVCEKTQIPYVTDPKAVLLFVPKDGIYVKFSKIV